LPPPVVCHTMYVSCPTWPGAGGAATLLLSDSTRDFLPPLPFQILPSWTSIEPSFARASGGALVAVRGHVQPLPPTCGLHPHVSHNMQGFDLSAAFACVFTSNDGSAVMSKVMPSCHFHCLSQHSHVTISLLSLQPPASSAACNAPVPAPRRLPALVFMLLCSVPQRDAAAARTTRFTLSMDGLEVFSSISIAHFMFTESISAAQLFVPAHALVFDVSGFGQYLTLACIIHWGALIVSLGFVSAAVYTVAVLPSLQLPPAAVASCARLRPTSLRCSVRSLFAACPSSERCSDSLAVLRLHPSAAVISALCISIRSPASHASAATLTHSHQTLMVPESLKSRKRELLMSVHSRNVAPYALFHVQRVPQIAVVASAVAAFPARAPCDPLSSPLPITLQTSNMTWGGPQKASSAVFINSKGFKG
jgi:hypothetical protein